MNPIPKRQTSTQTASKLTASQSAVPTLMSRTAMNVLPAPVPSCTIVFTFDATSRSSICKKNTIIFSEKTLERTYCRHLDFDKTEYLIISWCEMIHINVTSANSRSHLRTITRTIPVTSRNSKPKSQHMFTEIAVFFNTSSI